MINSYTSQPPRIGTGNTPLPQGSLPCPHPSAKLHSLVCYNVAMIELTHSNRMMAAASKKEFHFSGNGIWRNKVIPAKTREEAEEIGTRSSSS